MNEKIKHEPIKNTDMSILGTEYKPDTKTTTVFFTMELSSTQKIKLYGKSNTDNDLLLPAIVNALNLYMVKKNMLEAVSKILEGLREAEMLYEKSNNV